MTHCLRVPRIPRRRAYPRAAHGLRVRRHPRHRAHPRVSQGLTAPRNPRPRAHPRVSQGIKVLRTPRPRANPRVAQRACSETLGAGAGRSSDRNHGRPHSQMSGRSCMGDDSRSASAGMSKKPNVKFDLPLSDSVRGKSTVDGLTVAVAGMISSCRNWGVEGAQCQQNPDGDAAKSAAAT